MTYKGISVFEWDIDWMDPANGEWEFDLGELQLGFGRELLDIQQDHIVHGWQFTADFRDDDITDVNTFLDALQGRANPFWFPGPPGQFRVESGIDSFSFRVTEQGADDSWQLHPGLHVWITRSSDTPQAAEVTAVTDIGGGQESVTLADELDYVPDALTKIQPLYLVRLADDTETVEVMAERWQRRSFKVAELPHDYALLEPGVTQPSKPVFLYRFTAQYGSGDVVWRFTSHPTDVTLSDTTVWLAAPIQHNRLSKSTRLGGTVVISGDYDKVEPLRLCVPMRIIAPLKVEVLQSTTAFGAPTLKFVGAGRKPEVIGRKVTLSCSEWGDAMDVKIPTFFIQRDCPYTIYDTATCKADKASKQVSVSITAISGRVITMEGAGLAGLAINWFAGGWVEFGTGINTTKLFVMSSAAASGSVVTATVAEEPSFEVPIAATAVPGCTGERSTCVSKFNNLLNFGGAATPRTNLTLKAIRVNPTTGGKK